MNKGFTLIELAVVLVIIGLLVAGVLTGQHLIKVAQLNRFMTEMRNIETAASTFRAKYNCIPGDCTRPDKLGLISPTNSSYLSIMNTDPRLLGNNSLNEGGENLTMQAPNGFEQDALVWTELYNSGLYLNITDQMFNMGMEDTKSGAPIVYKKASIWFALLASIRPGVWAYIPQFSDWNGLSNLDPDCEGNPVACFSFTPYESYYVDSKVDDGNPFKGNFVVTSRPIGQWLVDESDKPMGSLGDDVCVIDDTEDYYYTENDSVRCVPLMRLNF